MAAMVAVAVGVGAESAGLEGEVAVVAAGTVKAAVGVGARAEGEGGPEGAQATAAADAAAAYLVHPQGRAERVEGRDFPADATGRAAVASEMGVEATAAAG